MSNFQATTDPRERMLVVGNRLLDVVYELDQRNDEFSTIEDRLTGDGAERASLTADDLAVLSRRLVLMAQRDHLLREYVTLRSTIEALTGTGVRSQ